MKFFAILRDSLREAIDLKVFYVMVALSTIIILLACTLSFEPVGEAKDTMRRSAITLTIDSKVQELITRTPGPLLPKMDRAAQALGMVEKQPFSVKEVSPIQGGDNNPSAHYKVILEHTFDSPEAARQRRQDPSVDIKHIQSHFGNLNGALMVKVDSVKLLKTPSGSDKKLEYELHVSPTKLTHRIWPHKTTIFFGQLSLGEESLGQSLFSIEHGIVNTIGAIVTILISIIITAFFIPNMVRKGTIDLLVVKPIRRWTLLLFKFVGGLTFIFLNTTYVVFGTWVVLGLLSGVWATSYLLLIPGITFYFAVLYSASVLFGVLTRSPIASILLTSLVWAFLVGVSTLHFIFELQVSDAGQAIFRGAPQAPQGKLSEDDGLTPDERREKQHVFKKIVRAMHTILPRHSDLDDTIKYRLQSDLLFNNEIPTEKLNPIEQSPWIESLVVTLCFMAVMLGLACLRFSTKDY